MHHIVSRLMKVIARSFVTGVTLILVAMPILANTAEHKISPVYNKTTGLVDAEGHNLVAAHCSACHSPKLIAQNNMSRERWLSTIRWMQKTQKLWPLGDAEPKILDYLSTWYGPKTQSRRPPLATHLMPPVESNQPD